MAFEKKSRCLSIKVGALPQTQPGAGAGAGACIISSMSYVDHNDLIGLFGTNT